MSEVKIRDTKYTITEEGVITSPYNRIMKPWRENNAGYWVFRVRTDNKPKCYRLHRILAEAFIPNPLNLPFVKHKDDNKDNNVLSNLEWGTNAENAKEGYDNGCYAFKQRAYPIKVTSKTTGLSEEYKSLRYAAEATGMNRKNISAVLKGKKNNTYDYTFEYML